MDINCDMGENRGNDNAVIKYISSANIACGGHAGDMNTMKRTIELALVNGVNAGAHPGYSDPANFGRVETGASVDEILEDIMSQIHLFESITKPNYIKFHGALYNRAAADYGLMTVLTKTILSEFGKVPIYTLAGSVSERAVADAGGIYVSEGFADRAYDSEGKLVPRSIRGAVIHDTGVIKGRISDMANGTVVSIDGFKLAMRIDTVCVHGDTPGAVAIAAAVHEVLCR